MNIGIIKKLIINRLTESYFDNTEMIDENAANFMKIVENSEILQLEYNVFNNLEFKFIENELLASRYIDSNIKLFETFTLEEIKNEHAKLKSIITENIEVEDNKLYESISNLIEESLKFTNVDVDKITESYAYVLKHIQKPKEITIVNDNDEMINENVIEIAIEKYNEKYNNLNESDKNLIVNLIKFNNSEKNELFETLKNETVKLLENSTTDATKENINKTIKRINETLFDKATIDENILKLYELKKEIL